MKVVLAVVAALALMVALPGTSFAASSGHDRTLVDAPNGYPRKVAVVAEYWDVGDCIARPGAQVVVEQADDWVVVEVDLTSYSTDTNDTWVSELEFRTAAGTLLLTTGPLVGTKMVKSYQDYVTKVSWSGRLEPEFFPYLREAHWKSSC
ncbi:hypothetical protein KIH74_10280 [Kineosporia sp. J2-2]|uniref:Uncharacterized protein n=1 Tax=Kineosporia corallincola TaxID=2835133 RepID=A0ABS5TDZ5_9ACTN|nr:hypothetical protein [Kineosporia corallincola]MBT0769308.1 hypothetical protein [Kineosporia corallincola]